MNKPTRRSWSQVSPDGKELYTSLVNSGQAVFYPNLVNPVTIEGDTTIIHCFRKGEILKCYIDTEDLPKMATSYAINIVEKGDLYAKIGSKSYIHRLVMKEPEGLSIHHKNHNTLDNRKANLEAITHEENMIYKKLFKTNTTGRKNIVIKNGYYAIHISRTFINRDYAEEALDKIQGIIQHYSMLDAREKAQAKMDSYDN